MSKSHENNSSQPCPLPKRLCTIAQLLQVAEGVINRGALDAMVGSALTQKASAVKLLSGIGSVVGLRISFGLFLRSNGDAYGEASFPIRVPDADEMVIPVSINWKTDGDPLVDDPLNTLFNAIWDSWDGINRQWLSGWYVKNMPSQEVSARLADQMQHDIERFLRDVSIRVDSTSASRSLVRIAPFPTNASRSTPQTQLESRVEAATRVKNIWPDQIDIAAGSQDHPLTVASLAENGVCALVSGTPFNANYVPCKRSFMIRSASPMKALHPSTLRVTVQDKEQPFKEGVVLLATAWARTPFNSLDAQAITTPGCLQMTSTVTKRTRVHRPVAITAEKGGIYTAGTALAYDHEGKEVVLNIPDRAVPPGMEIPMFNHEATIPGKAIVTDLFKTMDYSDGVEAEVWEIHYQYLHVVGSGDKMITPHGIKGSALEADFEARAHIGAGEHDWFYLDVLSSDENIHKRGSAALLHGALELACELDNCTMSVPETVTWEAAKDFAPAKVKQRFARQDKILNGQVPVQYRVKNDDGTWGDWLNLGFCWVGLVPWMRTGNTAHVGMAVGKGAVPSQLITEASCLRAGAHRFADPLVNHYIPRRAPIIARQLLDLLSVPCVTLEQEKILQGLMTVTDGTKVVYRGKSFSPLVVDRCFQTVGANSMQVLLPEEHTTKFNTVEKAGPYPNTILDYRQSQGVLIPLDRIPWHPPGAGISMHNVYAGYLFIPPELCREYLSYRTREPNSGRWIINKVALYLNNMFEIQAPGADPKGTRREAITDLLNTALASECTSRDGAFYNSYTRNRDGIRYVNLSLDICPSGKIFLTDAVTSEYTKKTGKVIKNGRLGMTVRFPISVQTGIQGVEVASMPRYIKAHVVTNSVSSEKYQDGDNDGDLCAVHFPPLKYAKEIRSMCSTLAPRMVGTSDMVPIEVFPSDPDSQLLEAIMMGELKAKIGPASSIIYHWIASERWVHEGETFAGKRSVIAPVLSLLRALMRSAVKKTIKDTAVWAMMALRNNPNNSELQEEVASALEIAADTNDKPYVRQGLEHFCEFYQEHPIGRSSLAYSNTLGSSKMGRHTNSKFFEFLKTNGTDGLTTRLRDELVYGAV